VIKFVSDLRQVGGFLRVLWFPPPIKLTAMIKLKWCWKHKLIIVFLYVEIVLEIIRYLLTSHNFTIPSYRLILTNSSFFPSTLRAWNTLDLENRNSPSYTSFKRQLVNKTLVPVWYSTGVRKWNIIHTKLRYNYSILNYDLYRFNLKDNPGCARGFEC
jgi:hypothetical protein